MRKAPIILILLAFCKISCNNTSSATVPNKLQKIKVIVTEISSSTGETFKLKSFIYDSCLIKHSTTTQTGVKRQELFFLKNGVQITKNESPIINVTYSQSNCTDSLQVMECSIYEIGVLEGTKGKIFSIKGVGLDNASPELFAFYDVNGKCVWLSYSNQFKSYKSAGDYDSVCKEIGVDTSLWLAGHYKKATIDL